MPGSVVGCNSCQANVGEHVAMGDDGHVARLSKRLDVLTAVDLERSDPIHSMWCPSVMLPEVSVFDHKHVLLKDCLNAIGEHK